MTPFARLRSLLAVVVLVATLGALPGAAPRANAETRTLTVATYELEPFVMTQGNSKYGFTIDLLDQIGKRNGWTFNYVDRTSVQQIMRAVADGQADMAACNISITADRAKRFDFSQPILTAGLQIAVPNGTTERTQPGLVDFLKLLFSKTMLIWLWAALVLTIVPAHIIWLLERRDPKSRVSKRYFPGIFEAFEWGLGMLAAAPIDEPRRWPARAVSVMWTFVSIIFVAYYTAILTANLTVEKFNSQISTPADLAGKSVCAVSNTTSTTALDKLRIPYTGVPGSEDCYPGLQKGTFDAIVNDAPILEYFVAHDGAGVAELAGPVFKEEDYGVVFPLGSSLGKQFDQALLELQEDGEYSRIQQKWFGSDG